MQCSTRMSSNKVPLYGAYVCRLEGSIKTRSVFLRKSFVSDVTRFVASEISDRNLDRVRKQKCFRHDVSNTPANMEATCFSNCNFTLHTNNFSAQRVCPRCNQGYNTVEIIAALSDSPTFSYISTGRSKDNTTVLNFRDCIAQPTYARVPSTVPSTVPSAVMRIPEFVIYFWSSTYTTPDHCIHHAPTEPS